MLIKFFYRLSKISGLVTQACVSVRYQRIKDEAHAKHLLAIPR